MKLNDKGFLFDKEELKRRRFYHRGRSLMTNAIYETSSGLYLLGTRNRRHRVFKETNGSSDYVWCCTSAQCYPRCRLFALGLNKLAVTDSCAWSWNVFLARYTCFFSVEITTRYFSFVFSITKVKCYVSDKIAMSHTLFLIDKLIGLAYLSC